MSEIDFNAPSNDLTKESEDKSLEANPKQEGSEEKERSREKSLHEKLEQEMKKSAELSKRALYLQADLVNTQRQFEKRISEAREEAGVRYIEELISLKEDFERALVAAFESKQLSGIMEGLQMLLSRLDTFLAGEEVRRIDVKEGSPLDTRYQEVVAFSHVPNKKDGSIVSVVRNGYTFKGKVIKPALVEVARARKEEEEELGRKEEISVDDTPETRETSS